MWIVFDILVIAIIALFTFIGYKQGLMKSLIKLLSFFIAIIIAFVLYKPVSKIIINNTSIDENIKNAMIENIKINNEEQEGNENKNIVNRIQDKIMGTTETAIEEVAEVLTVKLIEICTLLLIFIVLRIILIIITLVTDLISKIPGIKQLNKAGGTIYGFVKGIVLVYTILAVVYLVTPLLKIEVAENIDKSIITKTLYNNNLILNIFI